MKKKIIILLFLLTFPSVFYVILTTGKTNFIHLRYYGKKTLAENKKDTVYQCIPDFKLVNQDGDTITDKTYSGKIYVADFFFTSCKSICPKMTTELLRVQEKFEYTSENVKILSFTINPEKDSVPVLKAFADMVHADTKMWNFVTGDKKQLYDLIRIGYGIDNIKGDGNSNDFEPSKMLVLIDKEKHIRGYYDGTNIKEVNNLLDDVKVLIAEYFIKDSKNRKSNE